MSADTRDELGEALVRLMETRAVHAVFQPIIDFRARAFIGYEALIRGPDDSPLHRPDALFGAARERGLGLALEHICREAVVEAFVEAGLSGRLFLNVSPGALLDGRMRDGATTRYMARLGLSCHRVVLELTENEQIASLPELYSALAEFRQAGFQIAIDDLGEGFANLRMWSDLRPEYVKIDKHFVRGISGDKIKYHFVRAMQDLAEICHAALIAEGIEDEDDFLSIRDMGIACGQGYFIAHPTTLPIRSPRSETLSVMARHRIPQVPGSQQTGRTTHAARLAKPVMPVLSETTSEQVLQRFDAEPQLTLLPVIEADRPVGLISRQVFFDCISRPYQKEIFLKRACIRLMDAAPLIVEHDASLQDVALLLAQNVGHGLKDGFLICENGRYLGIGFSQDLMAAITEMQLSAARYANPLTQLPGNVPINEFVDRMLELRQGFVAAYVDIDNFKPFNDTFGYRRGDDVIQLLAQIILEQSDPRTDFVGHIGGDDFFVVFQSEDWEQRCWQITTEFSLAMAAQLRMEGELAGGYLAENRRGETVRHPLPALSIGAVRIVAGAYESHREVAAAASEAKKLAKKESKRRGMASQGFVFVERRGASLGLARQASTNSGMH